MIAAAFCRMFELFYKAVNTVVRFAQSGFGGKFGGTGHKDIFNNEVVTIKDTMVKITGEKGDHLAVGNWLVLAVQSIADLIDTEVHRAQREVDDVANGKYDWRIEKTNATGQSIS